MHNVKPEVSCLHFSGGPDMMYLAARRCTAKEEGFVKFTSEHDTDDRAKMGKLIRDCMEAGHDSILEHVFLTFHIQCSRACSHQIVRHRLASYAQQSQRFVKVENLPFLMPDFAYLGENRVKAEAIVNKTTKIIEDAYHDLEQLGAKSEDARCVLHEATATQLITTMNCRELLAFFKLRCCNRAQAEIRSVAKSMLDYCNYYLPEVFNGVGPKCLSLGKCPEKKPCGKAPWRA